MSASTVNELVSILAKPSADATVSDICALADFLPYGNVEDALFGHDSLPVDAKHLIRWADLLESNNAPQAAVAAVRCYAAAACASPRDALSLLHYSDAVAHANTALLVQIAKHQPMQWAVRVSVLRKVSAAKLAAMTVTRKEVNVA